MSTEIQSDGTEKRSQRNISELRLNDSGYLDGDRPAAISPATVATLSKDAPDNSSFISSPSSVCSANTSSCSSNLEMRARIIRADRTCMYFSDSRISEELSVHLRSNIRPSLSSSELIFILTAQEQGIRRAIFLASIFHWKFQRPLQALLAAMNEPGKSYTKRSAKARPRRSDAPLRCVDE